MQGMIKKNMSSQKKTTLNSRQKQQPGKSRTVKGHNSHRPLKCIALL